MNFKAVEPKPSSAQTIRLLKFTEILIFINLFDMGCGVSSGSGLVTDTRDVSEKGDEDSNLDFRFNSDNLVQIILTILN